jgi:NTP pyrophosphatase (non-canonical NTP hydrolase)
MEIHEIINCVREWGIAKGIIGPEGKATERGQLAKLLEEVGELQHAIRDNIEHEKIDAIGDCTVVLILLADLIGVPFEECLGTAYDVISKRTGKMVDGQFVKDNN